MKKIKNFITVTGLVCLCALGAAGSTTVEAADYYVLVNTENTFSGSDEEVKSLLRRVYLKTAKNWPGGEAAVPLARKELHSAHVALLASILSMTEAEHSNYWARLKQITGDPPPRAVGSDSILVRLIKHEPGAVGIIESSGDAPEGVRVLLKFSFQQTE